MRTSIIIGVILILSGSLYGWWWNEANNQFLTILTTSPLPANWEDLDKRFPQLGKALRILEIDIFAPTVENAKEEALAICAKEYQGACRHARYGLLAILSGFTIPIVTAVRRRKKRQSEPAPAGDVAKSAAPEE